MVIYGWDDINILNYFTKEALWDFQIVLLCKDNNISRVLLRAGMLMGQEKEKQLVLLHAQQPW